uniref:Receptor expression-enhancing protein n=1 Tax=Parastrongyloides trichosuri TaxID=131310 RepID=A0A0N4Z7N6_PARTI
MSTEVLPNGETVPTNTKMAEKTSTSKGPDPQAPELVVVHKQMVEDMYKPSNPTLELVFKKFEESTGQKREYLVYGIWGLISLYLLLGSAAELLCNLIGFGYPAYKSVQAVKSPNKDDDTQWLIYWCVFGFFSCVDFFADDIFGWFPFYYLFKSLFLLYLALPYTNGAIYFYKKYAEPIQEKIDAMLKEKKQE